MSRTVAELLDEALALPDLDRAELAERLAESLQNPPGPLHPAWVAELHRRAAEIDAGQVRPIPWDEVRREVLAELDADDRRDG